MTRAELIRDNERLSYEFKVKHADANSVVFHSETGVPMAAIYVNVVALPTIEVEQIRKLVMDEIHRMFRQRGERE